MFNPDFIRYDQSFSDYLSPEKAWNYDNLFDSEIFCVTRQLYVDAPQFEASQSSILRPFVAESDSR